MRVRLTKKLAEMINGVDLRPHKPGDVLDLPDHDARLLLSEEWATVERRKVDRGEHARQFSSRPSTDEHHGIRPESRAANQSTTPPERPSVAADKREHSRLDPSDRSDEGNSS